MEYYSGNPNYSDLFLDLDHLPSHAQFLLSDSDVLDDALQYSILDQHSCFAGKVSSSEKVVGDLSVNSTSATSENHNIKCKNTVAEKEESRIDRKIAFRTQSKIEMMDDGFKWRKYGKKMVKNSSNPRNYYKCSSGGCKVKKRVERETSDPSYVITTYEGVHNHESPSAVHHNQWKIFSLHACRS